MVWSRMYVFEKQHNCLNIFTGDISVAIMTVLSILFSKREIPYSSLTKE